MSRLRHSKTKTRQNPADSLRSGDGAGSLGKTKIVRVLKRRDLKKQRTLESRRESHSRVHQDTHQNMCVRILLKSKKCIAKYWKKQDVVHTESGIVPVPTGNVESLINSLVLVKRPCFRTGDSL